MTEGSSRTRQPDLAVPLALATLGVVGGLTVALVRRGAGFSFASDAWGFAALLLPGLFLACVGASALAGRRPRRLGVLITLIAVTWLLAEWDSPQAGSAVVFTTGLLTYAACPALVGHVAFADQRGRLTSWSGRSVALLGYLTAVGLVGLGPALFYEPRTQGCFSCPPNLLLVSDRPALAESLSVLGMRSEFAWTVVALLLVCWRLARASPTARRVMAPVAVPALAFMSSVAWAFGMSLDRSYLGSSELDRRLWLVQSAALVAMALGQAWVILRARRIHRDLVRLVMDLDRMAPSGGLQTSLARMLGDPGLMIAYPRDDGSYVDSRGQPVCISGSPALTTLTRDGRDIAVLLHRPDLLDDPNLVEEIVSATHLGLENERLRAEGMAQLADLQASRLRIVQAGDEERRRLERDLHDGAQQRLVGLSLGLRLLPSDADPSALQRAQANLRAAIDELRELAQGLFPVALRDHGLAEALSGLAESAPLLLREVPRRRFPDGVEATAYLVVARAVAAGHTVATITTEDAHLVVHAESRVTPEDLADLTERVHTLDGTLEITAHGRGTTRIRARIPVPATD